MVCKEGSEDVTHFPSKVHKQITREPALVIFPFSFFSGQKLGFIEIPQNVSATAGDSLLLKCKANSAVQDCQWSWQSLEDGPNGTVTLVKEYPAFGDEITNDCSVRFSALLTQQQGFWICGIRDKGAITFINSPPAKLIVDNGGKFNKLYKSMFSVSTKFR
jgi:hypothetical protein